MPATRCAAALLVLLGLACGGDDAARSDAGPGNDDGPDAAAYGPATVILVPQGQPLAGQTIIFHGADGTVIAELLTDVDGAATHDVPRDALATWWDGVALRTVADVQPGDVIRISSPSRDDGEVVGTVRVRVQGPVAGANQYWVSLGCNFREITDTGAFTAVELEERCVRSDGTFDIVARAYDAQESGLEVALAFAYALDVAAEADGITSVTLPAWDTTPPSVVVTYADAPADVTQLAGSLTQRRNGIAYGGGEGRADLPATDPTFGLAYPDDFAALLEVWVYLTWGNEGTDDAVLFQSSPAPLDSVAVTDGDFAPRVSEPTVELTTPGRPVLHWEGDTRSTDGVWAIIQYGGPLDIEPSRFWYAAVPPGNNEFRFPALPDSLAEERPPDDVVIGARGTVVSAFEATFVDGFADFRDRIFLPWGDAYIFPGDTEYRAVKTFTSMAP